MECQVLSFENKYNKKLKPMLSSRGLINANDLTHPSTLFLHRQTFKILKFSPSYVSSFDVIEYECGAKDEKELEFFL
jgi:hypothetical protein